MEKIKEKLSLACGPSWKSFEQFRSEGAKALSPVQKGKVAILHTKTGQYRILEESDFQKLYGLARDVERIQGGLRMVYKAVRAVEKNQDEETMEVLMESINLLGNFPELPTRSTWDDLTPEDLDSTVDDDEVTLSPEDIERPLEAN